MRNLKKFLALALAMVMAFSLVLSANALDKYNQVKAWDDKDQVTKEFVEAVDVLSGMKIFQGDERGFAPGSTITRAETAALIYRLATGDVENVRAGLYANYGNFTDVNEGDWFAGYVGYCANAGYIKGTTPTTFNPYAPVTGYEALAMILRAVGYDKNHEFEGATWQTNVSALGTRLGVLDKVRTSDYANTLHLPSRRDVVASILFETASEVATVTYTPSLGYETTNVGSGNTADGWNARTLGKINFGLDKVEGIIVGNQDTGESNTRINSLNTSTSTNGGATAPDYAQYFHQTRNFNENLNTPALAQTTNTTTIDAKTGIDMFGHKVKAWYCSATTNGATRGKTFALYDNAVKTAVVTASSNVLSNTAWAAKNDAPLGEAAQAAGFNVDLKRSKAVFNQDFGVSGSVAAIAATEDQGKSDYVASGTNANVGSGDNANGVVSANKLGEDSNTAYPLYLLISNSSDKKVDMVVALSTNVSRVAQVNNHASYPTVTVPQFSAANDTWNKQALDMIHQTALTATSTKVLGDPVVGVAIIGTNTPDVKTLCTVGASTPEATGYVPPATTTVNSGTTAAMFYRLSKPLETVEGTVTNFNYDQASHTGSIVIGGKTIERSYLADDIADYDADPTVANRGILGTKAVNLSATAQLYGNYRAYLDSEGKYIWVEPIYESKFVYATYIDYTTPYGSSTYEYTLIGVDLNGEQVKQVVKTIDGQPITYSNYQTIAPSRDSGAGVAGVSPLSYIGYLISADGNLTTITDSAATKGGYFDTITPRVNQVGNTDATVRGILSNVAADNWEISSTDARLGTKNLTAATGGNAINGANTYFTNSTKFIVVDGAGTDTQKIEVYTGMTELLRGGNKVTITGKNSLTADKAYLADMTAGGTPQGIDFNEQMYYTQSALTYASVDGTNPMKVDTIILPKEAVTWTGASGLYYIGNPAQNSEIKSGKWDKDGDGIGDADRVYHLYTMYLDGEAQQVWLTNAPGAANAAAGNFPGDHALVKDSFYRLYDTGLKTPMGDTVYLASDGSTTAATTATAVKQPASLANMRIPNMNALAADEGPIIGTGPVATAKAYYTAATYSSQTATISNQEDASANALTGGINAAIYNVANAKVVNLNAANSPVDVPTGGTANSKGYVWPGVTDLTTLNDAASTAAVYAGSYQPKVAVQLDPNDNLTITTIYVCWDQTT